MINILLIGAPGAGKGTQAARLLKTYNLTYIATGDVIRDEIRNNNSRKIFSQAKSNWLLCLEH